MEGSEVSFKISLIDVASGGGEAGVGVGKRWFGEARWGKLGTYCLKVLMVLETSLLTCLGPHEARLVAPWCQAVSRWGVGWGGLGGWELSGIPGSGEPFLPGPTKGFSPGPWVGFLSMKQPPESSKENGNAVPRLCAHNKRGLGGVSSILSKRGSVAKQVEEIHCWVSW